MEIKHQHFPPYATFQLLSIPSPLRTYIRTYLATSPQKVRFSTFRKPRCQLYETTPLEKYTEAIEMPGNPPKNKSPINAISEHDRISYEPPPNMRPHPHHKIPISKMYDKIKDGCHLYEQPPTATMPGETTGR